MNNEEVSESLKNALKGFLLKTSLTNIQDFLNCESIPAIPSSISELEAAKLNELNNRFYKTHFGTGGMRGGPLVNKLRRQKKVMQKGQHQNMLLLAVHLNEITVLRATKALFFTP